MKHVQVHELHRILYYLALLQLYLSPDLLLNVLLGVRQGWHGGDVGPAQRMHDWFQNHITEKLTHMGEEDIQHSVPNL